MALIDPTARPLVHVYALFGSNSAIFARNAQGKAVIALCARDRYSTPLSAATHPPCDECGLLWAAARANIGDHLLKSAPFNHGGSITLAPLFYVHRLLGTDSVHFAWEKWKRSAAFHHLGKFIKAPGVFDGCFLCGHPYHFDSVVGTQRSGPCRVCSAHR
ncbi:MAG: hypothetical protein WAV09_03120 [Minisyncoccia bacterium]